MRRVLAGENFCLTSDVLAIEMRNGRTCAVTVPAGSTVEVTAFPCTTDDRMAEVIWGDRTAMIFGMDLIHRAGKVKAARA